MLKYSRGINYKSINLLNFRVFQETFDQSPVRPERAEAPLVQRLFTRVPKTFLPEPAHSQLSQLGQALQMQEVLKSFQPEICLPRPLPDPQQSEKFLL